MYNRHLGKIAQKLCGQFFVTHVLERFYAYIQLQKMQKTKWDPECNMYLREKNDWIGIRKSFFIFFKSASISFPPHFIWPWIFPKQWVINIEAVMCMKCMKEYINNLKSSNTSDLFNLFCTLILYHNNLKFIMEKKLYFYN